MKKLLLLLSVLLAGGVSGAWADGTWNITSTDLTTDGWADMSGSVPAGVSSLGSYTPWYRTENISVTQTGIVTITFRYTTGADQLVMLGVDLLDGEDNVVASDYHWGKSGGSQDANTYLVTASSTGSYKLRYIIHKDGNLDDSKGTITISKIIYADSYTNITQWYKIRMHSNQTHYLKTNGSALSFANATDDTNNFLWAFVGNPTDGFQIYSYNYGSTKAIDNDTPCGFTTSGTSNAIKLTGGRSGSSTSTKFCISMKNGGDYYNYQSDAIKRWSGNDEGSAFILEEATPVSLVEGSTELAPIYYAWRTAVGNNPAYMYTEDGAPKNPNNTGPSSFTDPIDAKYAWQFVGNASSGFAIKNKATGTFLGGRTASGGYMSMDASATCYFLPIYNSATTNKWYCKNYNYYIDRASNTPYAHTSGNNNDYIRLYNVKFSLSDAAAGLVVGSTSISDFSTSYLITTSAALTCETDGYVITAYDGYATLTEALENDADGTINLTVASSVSVTYKMMYNGSQIASIVVEEGIGSTASTPSAWTAPAYCSFTCPATEITSTPSPIEVTLNWDGPFTISENRASATWYYLTLKGNYFVSNGADTYPIFSSDMVTGEAGQWAFLGNPYSGVQVINKALDGYYLQDTESKPTMTTTASNWEVKQNNDKFVLKSSTRNYIDAYGNNLGYYGSIDGNQNFTVTLVPSNYYSWMTANVTPFFTSGSGYFYLDSEKSGYAAAKAIYDAAVSAEACTEANYSTLVSYIKTLDNYILPPTGYYRLKNYYYPTYYMNAETASPNGITSNTTAGTVVYLTKTDNTYTMQMQGSYLQTPAQSAQVTLSSSSVTFTPSVGKAGWASFNAGGGYYGNLHMAGGKTIVGWCADGIEINNASYWEVEDADDISITLNSDGAGTPTYYATLCLPFDATISGADAFTFSKSGSYLIPTPVTDNEVPAGTPVLLKGSSATATATINTGDAFNSGSPLACALTGTYTDMSVTKTEDVSDDYFLGVYGTTVGFYKWNGTTLKANRAYLLKATAEAAGVKGYTVNWDDVDVVTSVENVQPAETAIYNLAGLRLKKLQKGVNLVNGKAIIVK